MKKTTHKALEAAYSAWEQNTGPDTVALAGTRLAGVVWTTLQLDPPEGSQPGRQLRGLDGLDPEDFLDTETLHEWEKRAAQYGHLEDPETSRCEHCDMPVEVWSSPESHWVTLCPARLYEALLETRDKGGNIVTLRPLAEE